MKMKNIFLLCCIVFAAISCELGGDEVQVVPDIEETFRVDLWEDLTRTQRSFTLGFEAIEELPCENDGIAYNLDKDPSDGKFTLTIENIKLEDGDCLGGSSIAEEAIEVSNLPLGVHDIQINLRDVIVNKGILEVSEKGYEIILDSHAGLAFQNWELMRIPEQSFWGYAGFIGRPSSNERIDSPVKFIEGMRAYANEITPEIGYYGYFKVDSLSNMTILKEAEFQSYEPLMTTYTPFFFTHYDNLGQIKQFTQDYIGAVNNPNFHIQIFTSNGDSFMRNTENE